ncbi:DUF488 domain-containing protein [Persephonella sp.]
MKLIYTIGHSTHTLDEFYEMLIKNEIDVIVDVRSIPFSKFANWFNKDNLKDFLKTKGIYYIFMGDNLGARWEDKNLIFDDGKVNFEKVKETKKFQDGIGRLVKGIQKGYKIALMCSEKEALDCHRFVLISPVLDSLGYKVFHIYPNYVSSQKELVKRLFDLYKVDLHQKKLFNQDLEENKYNIIKKAFELRNKEIAYNIFTKMGDIE